MLSQFRRVAIIKLQQKTKLPQFLKSLKECGLQLKQQRQKLQRKRRYGLLISQQYINGRQQPLTNKIHYAFVRSRQYRRIIEILFGQVEPRQVDHQLNTAELDIAVLDLHCYFVDHLGEDHTSDELLKGLYEPAVRDYAFVDLHQGVLGILVEGAVRGVALQAVHHREELVEVGGVLEQVLE